MPAPVQCLLCCEALPGSQARLKLLLLNTGRSFAADDVASVQFVAAEAGAPGDLSVPVATAAWAPDQVTLADLGIVSLAPPCPAEVDVVGGLSGQPDETLGQLRRTAEAPGVVFRRAYPGGGPAPGRAALTIVASFEPAGDRLFGIALAALNCGERLPVDEDIFLHFEPAATGSDLPATTAIGLGPAARPTDSSLWSEGEITVVRFGPYAMQAGLPEFVYLRAGLYNRAGDGERLPLEGPDDTDRALVGRLVTRDGKTWFERPAYKGSQLPAGWEPAQEVGE